ncbi:hypothetical protein [Photobacterium rosenbergii]|uniref:hypothetical protein n=1 Tax=Photobacterium rosenbergii TaxID=294936 RepID=UPI001C99FF64|nr:hypothetical protein [Photobacterium rosenbergii]MBY5947667.1 hypothetical protein [Photobacterium rosenbergii]
MNLINKSSPLLKQVNLENLYSFLSYKGWQRKSDIYLEKNQVFTSPKNSYNESIDLTVPKSVKFIDYYSRIADVVNTLSLVYERTPEDLINSIASSCTDIFKARIIDTGLFENSLPIEEVYREVGGIRALFLYGASSEWSPERHFDSPLSKGQKFLENCRFGHTFQGSFGFTVELPIIKLSEDRDMFELPFERKVNERIARGLNLIQESVILDDADILVNSYSSAFNSKMCDALLNLSNQSTKSVELLFNWAREIELSEDVSSFQSMILDERHYEVISYASEKLKQVPAEPAIISGRVINLHCSQNPVDDSITKSVVVKHHSETKGKIDVKATLNTHSYKNACEAHITGKNLVIQGTLERSGSQWILSKIKSVEIQN